MAEHTPGTTDTALTDLAGWSPATWQRAVKAALSRAGNRDDVAFLRRAAVYHMDLATLLPEGPANDSGLRSVARSIDGAIVGYEPISHHWAIGRQILVYLGRERDAERFVARWYRATLAFLLAQGNLAAAMYHKDAALAAAGDDAGVMFEAACFAQSVTRPQTQAVLRELNAAGRRTLLPDPDEARHESEQLFRKVVTLDPHLAEARLRLALLLIERDRPVEALDELRRAESAESDRHLQYLSSLFAARAEAALGRVGAARARYLKAQGILPTAQTPRIGLAALERGQGDRTRAWELLSTPLVPADPVSRGLDPWWNLMAWRVRPASSLVSELREMVARRPV